MHACSTFATDWAARPAPRISPAGTFPVRRTSTWTAPSQHLPVNADAIRYPDVAVFEEAMRAAGVSDDRPVVVYDDWGGRAAARCWWLLRWAGHRDVRVLDGGWPAWVQAGHDRSDVQKPLQGGDFTARPGLLPVLAVDEVLDLAERGVLVDAREPERFRGEVEPVDPVAGHIPGAVNVPTSANLRPDGRFRSPEELREVYAMARGTRGCGVLRVRRHLGPRHPRDGCGRDRGDALPGLVE